MVSLVRPGGIEEDFAEPSVASSAARLSAFSVCTKDQVERILDERLHALRRDQQIALSQIRGELKLAVEDAKLPRSADLQKLIQAEVGGISQQAITSLTETCDASAARVEALEARVAEKDRQAQCEALEQARIKAVASLKLEMDQWRQQLNGTRSDLAFLTKQVATMEMGHSERLAGLERRGSGSSSPMGQVGQDHVFAVPGALEHRISGLEGQLRADSADKRASVDRLLAQVESVELKLANLQETVLKESNEQERQELTSRFQELARKLNSDLDTRIRVLSKKQTEAGTATSESLTKHASHIEALQKQCEGLNTSQQELQWTLSTAVPADADLQAVRKQCQTLETRQEDQLRKLEQCLTQGNILHALQKQCEGLTLTQQELQQRCSPLEQGQQEMLQRCQVLHTRLQELSGKAEAAQVAEAEIQARVRHIEVKHQELSTKLSNTVAASADAANQKHQALESRQQELGAKVANLIVANADLQTLRKQCQAIDAMQQELHAKVTAVLTANAEAQAAQHQQILKLEERVSSFPDSWESEVRKTEQQIRREATTRAQELQRVEERCQQLWRTKASSLENDTARLEGELQAQSRKLAEVWRQFASDQVEREELQAGQRSVLDVVQRLLRKFDEEVGSEDTTRGGPVGGGPRSMDQSGMTSLISCPSPNMRLHNTDSGDGGALSSQEIEEKSSTPGGAPSPAEVLAALESLRKEVGALHAVNAPWDEEPMQ